MPILIKTAPIRENLIRQRGSEAYRDVIGAIDKAYPKAETVTCSIPKSPEERAKIVGDVYKQLRGTEMPAEMKKVAEYQARILGTPEQVGAYMKASQEGPKAVDAFYAQRMNEELTKRASAGDESAKKSLDDLKKIHTGLSELNKTNPTLCS